MIKSFLISASALTLAAPAVAQPAAPVAAASSVPAPKDPNRIICERQEEIGTRLGGARICHTAAEWDALRRASREQVQEWQQRLTANPKPAG